jgi:APA family basic amino acid/polyamine antiporter
VVPSLGLHVSTGVLAAAIIVGFTLINCIGVRYGATTQHVFMGLNAAMILVVAVIAGLHPAHVTATAPVANTNMLSALGLAMVAVMFAYDGWHTASFASAELKSPERSLPRGITIGVGLVIVFYLVANWAFVYGMGIDALARSQTPATDLAKLALGNNAAGVITALVAIATMSTLAQQILVSPRVYHQMALDGTFFRALGRIDPRTRVPVVAIVAQGLAAAVVAISGSYAQILNYVESVDFVFFGLAAIALFIFRKRDDNARTGFMMPLHPYSTALFLVVSWGIVADIAIASPRDTFIGLGIMAGGIPVYWIFRARRATS